MPQQFADHFAQVAGKYAACRPTYPPSLFTWLAEIAAGHQLAWDCACGTGQASVALATHFDRVVATDASAAQIQSATPHPKIEYRVARAEDPGLPALSVDLITVAQALHWFDLDAFYAEVRRVLKPGGALAVWTYGILEVEGGPVDAAVQNFRVNIVGPYWPPERKHVDDGYRTLAFPFQQIPAPEFHMQASWTLPEFTGYLRTWSATARFAAQRGFDATDNLERELMALWPASSRRTITWPLKLRVART